MYPSCEYDDHAVDIARPVSSAGTPQTATSDNEAAMINAMTSRVWRHDGIVLVHETARGWSKKELQEHLKEREAVRKEPTNETRECSGKPS